MRITRIHSYTRILLLLFTAVTGHALAQPSDTENNLYTLSPADDYSFSTITVTTDSGTEYSIAIHNWTSGNDRMVFMIHGYADSCVYPKPLQRWFLENGYDVLCMELPGHGLSSGEPGVIEEMEDYRLISEVVFDSVDMAAWSQTVFYGHSTGNVGIMELLLDGEAHPFDILVMATPLIRTKFWHLSNFGKNILGWMMPRMTRRDLIDEPEYVSLKEKDPDYLHKVPMDFFRTVVRWNRKLKTDTRISAEPLHVIFAGKDSVINTRFNRQFYQEHFTQASFYEIKDSGHMLHYSRPEVRSEFFSLLEDILGSNSVHPDE